MSVWAAAVRDRTKAEVVRCSRTAFVCLVLMLGGFSSPAFAELDDLEQLTKDIGNESARLAQLKKEFAQPDEGEDRYELERRLVDATVLYGLGDFEKAGILFFDLLRTARFKSHPRYLDTQFKLGLCYYRGDNLRAAQTLLGKVAQRKSNYQTKALAYLVEIGLDLDDRQSLEILLGQLARLGPGAGNALRYVKAKALYRIGRHDEAFNGFGAVSPREFEYGAARYYRGVILTGQNNFSAAKIEFKQAAAFVAPEDAQEVGPVPAEIGDNARLALARIYMEENQSDKAIEFYQSIDRHSSSFEVALYEMTWVLLQAEKPEQALHTLEVLLLVAKDEALQADAQVMKGRLLSRLERYEESVDGFRSALAQFEPIQRELGRIAKSEKRLEQYFAWLVDRSASNFDVRRPVTERAAVFVEKSGAIKPVVKVFDQIGEEKAVVEASYGIARELKGALGGSRKFEVVPVLADIWTRLLANENRFINLQSRLLDIEAERLSEVASDEVRREGGDLAQERRQLEFRFRETTPTTSADYRELEAALEKRFRELELESFVARQLLERARKQLNAVEEWLSDPAQTGLQAGGTTEKKARIMLQEERTRLSELHEELVNAAGAIDVVSARVGLNDLIEANAANLKSQVLKAHQTEMTFYRKHRKSLDRERPELVQQVRVIQQSLRRGFQSVGVLFGKLEDRVNRAVVRHLSLVRAEEEKIRQYEAQLGQQVDDSKGFARKYGYQLFRSASDELNDVVLEADVGLINVSWQRKQEKSDRIRSLTEEKNSRLTELDEALQEISRDGRARSGVEGEATGAE